MHHHISQITGCVRPVLAAVTTLLARAKLFHSACLPRHHELFPEDGFGHTINPICPYFPIACATSETTLRSVPGEILCYVTLIEESPEIGLDQSGYRAMRAPIDIAKATCNFEVGLAVWTARSVSGQNKVHNSRAEDNHHRSIRAESSLLQEL